MNKKLTAHYLANRYPKRLIILFTCEHDGKKYKHHPDYNKPFEVEILCSKCHGQRPREYSCNATKNPATRRDGESKKVFNFRKLLLLNHSLLLSKGFDAGTLSNWKAGRRIPSRQQRLKLSTILKIGETEIPRIETRIV